MARLNARKVETLLVPGMHGDGEGLYLRVGAAGARSWILRTVVRGRRRDIGLGSASMVTLAEAREKAHELRRIARRGGDPLVETRRGISFSEAALAVHAALLPTWKNAKHAETWMATVRTHAFPEFGESPIKEVGTAEVLHVLSPIWVTKHETAKRLRQRLATIFDWAKGAGHYQAENPVTGVAKALPPVKKRKDHLAALDWRRLPAFVSQLREREGVSARTLEFIILTAARSGEARGARWTEIDDDIWTVPGERMKRGVPHRVPLSAEALAVLNKVRGLDSDLVFPSHRSAVSGRARPQSVMVFKSLMKRMGQFDFTTHGFRSSFRDWCDEAAHADRAVAEAALSHTLGSAVERAYARSDLIDRRRTLMESWGAYANGTSGSVVRFASR